MKKLDLTGMRFARLVVIKSADPGYWECICDCGKIKIVSRNGLRTGSTKSCGCLNMEKRKERAQKMYQAATKYSPVEASARRIWQDRYSDGNITFEQFFQLSQKDCYYCGSPPSGRFNVSKGDSRRSKKCKEEGFFIYSGLDRVDQKKPHDLENVVPCCRTCNFCKCSLSREEFLSQVKKIYDNIIRNNIDD